MNQGGYGGGNPGGGGGWAPPPGGAPPGGGGYGPPPGGGGYGPPPGAPPGGGGYGPPPGGGGYGPPPGGGYGGPPQGGPPATTMLPCTVAPMALAQGGGWRRSAPSGPYCGYYGPLSEKSRVSTGGWIVFGILIFFVVTFWLCWIGLFITEKQRLCSACRTLDRGRPYAAGRTATSASRLRPLAGAASRFCRPCSKGVAPARVRAELIVMVLVAVVVPACSCPRAS